MTIIEKTARPDGGHGLQSQSHRTENWMGEGWLEVPAHLESAVWACCGYCDLAFEGDRLTGVTPIERPVSPAVPTEEDDTNALLVDHEYRLTLLELGVSGEVN